MTDRRMTQDPDAEHDPAVSEAYREAATERAPEHLDRAVLAAAAQEARPTYSRLRMWTRPAAWAAVVMLSVALILETNNTPLPESPAPATGETVIRKDSASPGDPDTTERDAQAEVIERKAEAPVRKSQIPAPAGRTAADAEELGVVDEDLAKRAEEEARVRQSLSGEPAAAAAYSLEGSTPGCDEAARSEPETWLDCIAELEESGELEAARAERELFAETFPDFYTR
jgi:hypothetical protein